MIPKMIMTNVSIINHKVFSDINQNKNGKNTITHILNWFGILSCWHIIVLTIHQLTNINQY